MLYYRYGFRQHGSFCTGSRQILRWQVIKMGLANCKHCGRLVLQSRSIYCGECQAEYDNCYRTVRNFLRSHPNSTVLDIHKETGIPLARLLEVSRGDYAPYGT